MTENKKHQIDLVIAARPNFMKIAPLYHALKTEPTVKIRLVHTGQHYDANMSQSFLDDLGLPNPDVHLAVGSASHAQQTAEVMQRYDDIIDSAAPAWVVVVGDVNSTLACGLVCAKRGIPFAHLEAGLRSFDRRMPEELNRIVTDQLADLLWTPSADGDANLMAEGIPSSRVERVGNIMIDSFEMMRDKIEAKWQNLHANSEPYAVVTLHRPSNVDEEASLTTIVERVCELANELKLFLPLHPRTSKKLDQFGLYSRWASHKGIEISRPLAYVDFMALVMGSRFVLTDSGGVQEETSYLGVPCLTLRENTERPITMSLGTNQLITVEDMLDCAKAVLSKAKPQPSKIPLWDGKTAQRVVASLLAKLS